MPGFVDPSALGCYCGGNVKAAREGTVTEWIPEKRHVGIYRDADQGDHWRVVVSLGRAGTDEPRRRTVRVLHGGIKEAIAVRDELRELVRTKKIRPQAQRAPDTVGKWMDHWLETYKRRNMARSGYRRYQNDVRLYIKPILGKVTLKRLSVDDVQDFYNALSDRGLAPGTINQTAAVLKQALKRAVIVGVIPRNPMDGAEAPKQGRRRELVVPDREKVRELLRVMEDADSTAYPIVRMALASGLREGELIALEWSALDLKAGTLRVRRSMMRVPPETEGGPAYEFAFKEPKTPKSRRTVPIDPETVAWLREHRKRVRALKMQLRPRRWTDRDGDLVFACPQPFAGYPAGRAWEPNTLRKAFKRYAAKVGLGYLRFHDLRHTYASDLLRQGAPLKVVSEILGHEKIATTADTYGHVSEDEKRNAVATLADLWEDRAGR